MRKQFYKDIIPIISYILLASFSIRLLVNGIIGMRHDWSMPYYPSQITNYLTREFWLWSDLQSHPWFRSNLIYFKLFQGVIGIQPGVNGAILSMITIILLLALSGIFMYFFARKITSSEMGGFIAGVFYMLTPVVFNKIIAGHTGFVFSYALSPLVMFLFVKGTSLKNIKWKYIILSGLIFGFAFAQHQFIVLLPILIGVWLLSNWIIKKNLNLKELKAFSLLLIVGFLIHIFWIIPNLIGISSELGRMAPISYHGLSGLPTAWQSVVMVGWSHHYDYIDLINGGILQGYHITLLYILVLFAITALLIKKNYDNKIFAALIFLIGVSMATGTNDPGGDVFSFLYATFLPFRIFRDPDVFGLFIAFSLSVLLGFFTRDIIEKISHIFQSQRRHKVKRIAVTGGIVAIVVLAGYPILSGDFVGQVQPFDLPENYEKIYNNLSSESDLYRILYLPSIQPIKHPNNTFAGIDPMIQFPPKPSFPQNIDRLDRFNRFHSYTILSLRAGDNIENLLNVTSTKYILERPEYKSWYYKFVPGGPETWGDINFTEKLPPSYIPYYSSQLILHSRKPPSFIRITKPYLSTGNLEMIKSMPKEFINTSSLVYVSDMDSKIYNFPNSFLLTNELNTQIELSLHLSNSTHYLKLLAEETNPEKDWAFDDATWRHWPEIASQTPVYGTNTVLTSSNNATINTSFNVDQSDDYILFIRYFENMNGGSIDVSHNGKSFTINTKNQQNKFIWKNLGVSQIKKGNHNIILKNNEGFNAVSIFSLILKEEYIRMDNQIIKELLNTTVVHVFEGESDLYGINTGVSDRFGFEASNGKVLELDPNSQVWQEVEILKNDSYILAARGSGNFKIILDEINFDFNTQYFKYKYFGPLQLTKGGHNLTISPLGHSTLKNYTFENGIDNWSKGPNSFGFERSTDSYTGDYSLKIMTSSDKEKSWSWIRGTPVNVTPCQKYVFITHMKYSNVRQSHLPIEGYNKSSEEWKQLRQIPSGRDGTSGWKEHTWTLEIPENITKIRPVLNAGWVLNKSKGDAITWFDDIMIYPFEQDYLDIIWLYSTENNMTLQDIFSEESHARVMGYEKINPTMYKVNVNASAPFMLSFGEGYNKLWIAEIKTEDGVEQYKPIPLYGVLNGFWINKTGNMEIVIRYRPQDWLEIGSIISITTLIGCMGYLLYDWKKDDKRIKMIKKKILDVLKKKK